MRPLTLCKLTEKKTFLGVFLSLATLDCWEHMLHGGIQYGALQLPESPHSHELPLHGSCTWKNRRDSTEMSPVLGNYVCIWLQLDVYKWGQIYPIMLKTKLVCQMFALQNSTAILYWDYGYSKLLAVEFLFICPSISDLLWTCSRLQWHF